MKKYLILAITLLTTYATFAQVDKNSDLYKTILAQDSLLFDVGFNTCDIHQFEFQLSDSFKFYHDKDGTSNKTKFIADLRKGICNDIDKRKVKRFLVKKVRKFSLFTKTACFMPQSKMAHICFLNKGKAWRVLQNSLMCGN